MKITRKIYFRPKSWIFDILRDNKPTIIFCVRHFKFWGENAFSTWDGGKACGKCISRGKGLDWKKVKEECKKEEWDKLMLNISKCPYYNDNCPKCYSK